MAIRDWHPGKVVLMWAGVVLLYSVFRSVSKTSWPHDRGIARLEDGYFIVWLLVGIVASAITWRWFSAREESKK